MSRRWNNFAMWANYAANHAGYCLELANEGLFAEAREVSYYATAPLLDIGEINAGTAGWMFVKSQDWSNEEEIRLVVPRVLGGPLISYAPELLRRIIVGHFMHPQDREDIKAIARLRTPAVIVHQAHFDDFDQQLHLVVP